jgi:hypothetical protein
MCCISLELDGLNLKFMFISFKEDNIFEGFATPQELRQMNVYMKTTFKNQVENYLKMKDFGEGFGRYFEGFLILIMSLMHS